MVISLPLTIFVDAGPFTNHKNLQSSLPKSITHSKLCELLLGIFADSSSLPVRSASRTMASDFPAFSVLRLQRIDKF
jgi:hypothetical protein